MGLKKCRECSHEVAASAPTCPSCGVKNPGKPGTQLSAGAGCLIIIVLLGVFAVFFGESDTGSAAQPAAPAAVPGASIRYTWGPVNVREGRGTGTPVATQLQVGRQVWVKDLQDGWWAAYNSGGRQLGYVANSVLHPENLPNKIAVYSMAQQFVEDNLRAPRTAKFPWGSDDHQVTHLGGGKYRVASYVDAQNAFGAMIRNSYTVVMQYVGNDRWRLEDVAMF